MKKELTNIEIKYLVQELQGIVRAKVDKIYQPKKKELLIQLHVTNVGKQLLRMVLPSFMWLTSVKQEMPNKMSDFCSVLRKHLTNSRIVSVEQFESERIVKIVLEKKEKYELYIELFSKGNVILCQNDKIIMPLEVQKWKDRFLKKGEEYKFASRDNVFKMKYLDFEKKVLESKENISKTLALVLGLGRIYSEEICLLSGVDKLVQVKDKTKLKKVYDSLQKILKLKIDSQVVLDKGVVKNITPFALKVYSDFEVKEFDSFSSALDSVLAEQVLIEKKSKASKAYDEKLKQMNKRIEMQVASMEKLERSSVENQRKGEWIYENYQKVKKLILSARKDKKREIVIKS